MSVVTICKTVEEMSTFKSQTTTKCINSSTSPKLSEKPNILTMAPSSTVQSNQILLINNSEGQPISGILLPLNHFMLKLDQNQTQPEPDPEESTDQDFISKYFSMSRSEKNTFRETFFQTILDLMHQIIKDGRFVSSTDPVWDIVAFKLGNIIQPRSIYRRFILNKHSCRTRLIEAYLNDPKSQTVDASLISYMKTEIVEKRQGHVDNETFFDALFQFKEKILKNGEVASSVDLVWNQISAHLNHALKPNSIYLRFKRNTDNCYKKLLTYCQLDPSKAKTYVVSSAKRILPKETQINKVKKKSLKFKDSAKFFEALYTHRRMIIKDGSIARYNSSVWNEVAKMLDYALQPADIYTKFIRNHDLCQIKLIEACKKDKNFIPLVVPKINKPHCVSDDYFFEVLCKHRNDILQYGNKVAKFSHPVWTQISKDLNDTLKPATVYFRVTRNSQLCLNRLLKPTEVVSDGTSNDTVDKKRFFETICLYKYSIMNGDRVVDLNDPVWNEISLQLNSSLTAEAIYDAICRDKDLCKTKMVEALRTERSVFSGENSELPENIAELTPTVECNISDELRYDAICRDKDVKDVCKTKMIEALRTERSVFSGENSEIPENYAELTPIVECNIYDESLNHFNEILDEFMLSIIQPNGQMALKNDPVWERISRRLKYLKADEVYLRLVNNYKNCRNQLFGINPIHKNKFFDAIFEYGRLVMNNDVIASSNNQVWTKISEKLNHALTPKEIYLRFIKDVDGCRTKLLKSQKKNLTSPQNIDKDKFLDVIISYKDSILKNGSQAKPSDSVWTEIAAKLNCALKPLTAYNLFKLNRHNCQQKLLEACRRDTKNQNKSLVSSKITSQMDHDYTKGSSNTNTITNNNTNSANNTNNTHNTNTDTNFEDFISMRHKFGYVQENDFIKACLIFKEKLVKNNRIVPSTDSVWNEISKYLNYAIKSKTAYLRFKRNTKNCQEKLFGKLNEPSYEGDEESCSIEDQSIENEMFFDALMIFKHSIINYGDFAMESSTVWIDVSNLMNNLITPDEAYWKFRQNIDSCRTKLIQKCNADWRNESSSIIKNRTNLIKSKEYELWKETLKTENICQTNKTNRIKSLKVDDDAFYDAIYKHKNHIFHNDLIANCTNPVWTVIARELNNVLEPSTIHARFKNNMTKNNVKFTEAAQRHKLFKLKPKQDQTKNRTPFITDENSNDSCEDNLIIDSDSEEVVKSNA